jgi:DNA mismatch repair protein MSH2
VFSVHGKDALFVAETVYKTSTVLKYYGSQIVPSCTLSKVAGYQLIRDLLLYRGYSVEIWELDQKKWVISKTY